MSSKKTCNNCNHISCSKCHPLLHTHVNFSFAIAVTAVISVTTMTLLAVLFMGYSSGMAYSNTNVVASNLESLSLDEMSALIERDLRVSDLENDLLSLDIQSELDSSYYSELPVIAVAETMYEGDQAFLNSNKTYLNPVVSEDSSTPIVGGFISTNAEDFWLSLAIAVFGLGTVIAAINYLDEKHIERKAARLKTSEVKASVVKKKVKKAKKAVKVKVARAKSSPRYVSTVKSKKVTAKKVTKKPVKRKLAKIKKSR